MKAVRLHTQVAKEFERLDPFTERKFAEVLGLLAMGESIGLPLSRPMPIIANGAHELRIKDRSGQYRAVYFTKHRDAILVFHFLKKKTEGTPQREIEVARSRLKDML